MSNKLLLIRYIKAALIEAKLARVPNQLLAPSTNKDKDDDGSEDEVTAIESVNEFSGCAGVAGYSGPLGIDPDELGRKKNAPEKKK